MSPVVADNNYRLSSEGLAGDLFPGKGNVTELTNTSHIDYGGKLFNVNNDGNFNMNKSILNIREEKGMISFDVVFCNEIPTPIALEASEITQNSFKARWLSDNSGAESYTLELEIIKSLKPFVAESIMIDDISEQEYLVENLNAHSCNYRVRANKGDIHTEWSNKISVNLENTNGVNRILNDDDNSPVFYDLWGTQTKSKVSRGLYILDFGSYKKKVLK